MANDGAKTASVKTTLDSKSSSKSADARELQRQALRRQMEKLEINLKQV